MKFAIIALLLICGPLSRHCYAADRLMGDAYTHHSSGGFQQPHRVSWQHDLTEKVSSDIGVGTNSYGNVSVNAGLMYQPFQIGPFKTGLWASVVSGYSCAQLKTCLFAAGSVVSLQVDRVVLQVLYMPGINKGVAVTQLRAGLTF